jgi:hypothetical protein
VGKAGRTGLTAGKRVGRGRFPLSGDLDDPAGMAPGEDLRVESASSANLFTTMVHGAKNES